MSERPNPHDWAGARGVVTHFAVHRNSADKPWVTFLLETPAGALPCVCFPLSCERLTIAVADGACITVQGRVTSDGTELHVMEAEVTPLLPVRRRDSAP